jgi:hypothetical protein
MDKQQKLCFHQGLGYPVTFSYTGYYLFVLQNYLCKSFRLYNIEHNVVFLLENL